jgi:zinc and cadmium transporter
VTELINTWLWALVSVLIVSLMSLIGVITLAIKSKYLKKILLLLVSFSAGALFGGAFLDLIPEALDSFKSKTAVGLLILSGIVFFFVLEKFIHWRHCHIPTCKGHPHPMAINNMIGDSFHNFIDGLVIGSSYLVSFNVGLTTTLAVILHEIPQEMGDFGVLIYGGFKKIKALMINFLSALTAILGTIIALLIGSNISGFSAFLLPITAGGFIYIAGSDLIPELHKEEFSVKKSILQLISIVAGIVLILVVGMFE